MSHLFLKSLTQDVNISETSYNAHNKKDEEEQLGLAKNPHIQIISDDSPNNYRKSQGKTNGTCTGKLLIQIL